MKKETNRVAIKSMKNVSLNRINTIQNVVCVDKKS